MVMETREHAKSKAQETQAQNIMEDNKKKIPVVQAKMKLMNAQNKMKATLTQIKKGVEEFSTLEDTRRNAGVFASGAKNLITPATNATASRKKRKL